MADETPPPPTNGNGALKRDMAVAYILGGIVFALVAIMGISVRYKAEQWDLTVKIVECLSTLATTLAGGLLMKTRG